MTARQFAKHRETFCLASAGSDEEFHAYLSGFDAAVAIADLAAVPAQVRVKPLDLSNAMKHAFIAGRVSAGAASSFHADAWAEYDPTESAGYARILAAVPAQVRVKPLVGWVIGNGQGNRWRCVWKWETNAEWTDDISKAIKFATRDDAEAFSADDEDAWLIQELPIPSLETQPDPRDEVIARLVRALEDMLEIRAVWTDPHNDTDCAKARAAIAAASIGEKK